MLVVVAMRIVVAKNPPVVALAYCMVNIRDTVFDDFAIGILPDW
jgi:hypothetical protein